MISARCRKYNSNKREQLVNALVQRPEYVDFWSYIWSDLFKVNRGTLKNAGNVVHSTPGYMKALNANKPLGQDVPRSDDRNGNTFEDGQPTIFGHR